MINMQHILNEIPIKTTNSFKVNNCVIDLDLLKPTAFKNYDTFIDLKVTNNYSFTSKLGLKVSDGVKVDLNINASYDQPIILKYHLTNDTLYEEINIKLTNCNNQIIFLYDSDDNKNMLYNSINLNLENAHLNLSYINLLSTKSTHLLAINTITNKDSILNTNLFDLGGNIKISNYYGVTNKLATNNLKVIYQGINNDLLDMNYHLINQEKQASSDILVTGLLDDCATKTLKSTIKFMAGATASIGHEKEDVIVLSDDVTNTSVPLLLCDEEDVVGTHSVSSGNINEEALYYLTARGITIKEATKLLIMAKFNPIINNISDDDIKELIINNIKD